MQPEKPPQENIGSKGNSPSSCNYWMLIQSSGVFDANKTTKLQPEVNRSRLSDNNKLVSILRLQFINLPVSCHGNSKEALCVRSGPYLCYFWFRCLSFRWNILRILSFSQIFLWAAVQLNQTSTIIRTGLKLTSVFVPGYLGSCSSPGAFDTR